MEVLTRKSGEMRIWSSGPITRANVIANTLTRINMTGKLRDGTVFNHMIQTGGNDVELYFVNFTGFGHQIITDATWMFEAAGYLEEINFGLLEFSDNAQIDSMFYLCPKLNKIICKKSVQNYLLNNSAKAYLPDKFKSGGTGIWEIID